MNKNNDLKKLVANTKSHILKFLTYHGIKILNDQIELLYGEDIDIFKLSKAKNIKKYKPQLKQLWELRYEPELVWCSFTIEDSRNKIGILRELMKILSIKIVKQNWPDNPMNPIPYSEPVEDNYNCFQTIKFYKTNNGIEVILISSIGYFS